MRNENSYSGFNLFAGAMLLLAGYLVEPMFVVLGVLVISVGVVISIVTKVQEKRQRHILRELGYKRHGMTDVTATYILK